MSIPAFRAPAHNVLTLEVSRGIELRHGEVIKRVAPETCIVPLCPNFFPIQRSFVVSLYGVVEALADGRPTESQSAVIIVMVARPQRLPLFAASTLTFLSSRDL